MMRQRDDTPYLDSTEEERAALIERQLAERRWNAIRDPLAARMGKWPFRDHRSLAEIAERPADSGAA